MKISPIHISVIIVFFNCLLGTEVPQTPPNSPLSTISSDSATTVIIHNQEDNAFPSEYFYSSDRSNPLTTDDSESFRPFSITQNALENEIPIYCSEPKKKKFLILTITILALISSYFYKKYKDRECIKDLNRLSLLKIPTHTYQKLYRERTSFLQKYLPTWLKKSVGINNVLYQAELLLLLLKYHREIAANNKTQAPDKACAAQELTHTISMTNESYSATPIS